MGHEAGGQLARQSAHAGVDAAEPGGGRSDVRIGAGVEVRLHAGQPVDLALVAGLATGAEGLVQRGQPLDVLAHALHGRCPRHAHAILDVLSDLTAQAELKAAARQLGQVPRRVRGERRTADEGQRHAGADDDPLGVLGDEQGHGQRVVHGLGHVQPVETHRLHPPGVDDDVGQREPRIHGRVDLHVSHGRSCETGAGQRSSSWRARTSC